MVGLTQIKMRCVRRQVAERDLVVGLERAVVEVARRSSTCECPLLGREQTFVG
jgi:hypothetical protein